MSPEGGEPLSGVGRLLLLAGMASLGAFATLAQVVCVRELMVVCHGNELSIGLALATWLAGVGLGARLAGLGRRRGETRPWRTGWVVPGLLGCLLPLQVLTARSLTGLLGVPPGEFPSLGAVLVASMLVCLPSALGIGYLFPQVCGRLALHRSGAGGAFAGVYASEALGSLGAGVALSLVLLHRYGAAPLAGVGFSLACLCAGCFGLQARRRRAAWCLAGLVGVASLWPAGPFSRLEQALTRMRWRGLLAAGRADVVAAHDTVYQNLALIDLEGQRCLYADGRLQWVFPDELGDEHRVHPAMALYPDARRVLLIGGNLAADPAQLLRYPLQRLVCVDLDPGVADLVAPWLTADARAALADPRVHRVSDDPLHFARGTDETFDVILLFAPDPVTAAAARFYSLEFYRELRRILDPGGVLVTGVEVSERLGREAAAVGAEVYRTLRHAFRAVLPTAASSQWFVAGNRTILPDGTPRVTLDRQTLFARSDGAALATRYFRPAYFLGADELDPAKIAQVVERYRQTPAAINTLQRPRLALLNLGLWSRYSGSGLETGLEALHRMPEWAWAVCLLVAVGLALLVAGARGRRRPAAWRCATVLAALGATGCVAMGLELTLVMMIQSTYGTVYSRMALVVGVFMAGLAAGAPLGYAALRVPRLRPGWWFVAAEVVWVAGCLAVPRAGALALRLAGGAGAAGEWLLVGMVGAAGLLTGAQFVCGAALLARDGPVRAAASRADAADHVGAALGALVAGTVWIPALGAAGSCHLLAAGKCFTLAVVAVPAVCGAVLAGAGDRPD